MTTKSRVTKPFIAQLLAFFAAMFAIGGIAYGFYFLWLNQTANASLAFTVGFLLFLFSQFERFESFKGFGIEAKVLQLDNKIREADQINASLKKLTATFAQLTFEMMSRIGRMSGPIARKESLEIEESLLQQMRDAGIVEPDITRAVLPVRKVVAFDILRPAYDELDRRLSPLESAAHKRLIAVPKPIDTMGAEYINAMAEIERNQWMRKRLSGVCTAMYATTQSDDLRRLAADLKVHPQEPDFVPTQAFYEALDDYEHYIKTTKHRSVERWVSGKLE